MDFATGRVRSITKNTPKKFSNHDPVWSPDGRRLAFTRNRADEKVDILLVADLRGGIKCVSPEGGEHNYYAADWSPDGRSFAATSAPGDGDANWWIAQLYTFSTENGAMQPVYKPPVSQQIAAPRWSPDGKSIVFIGGLMSDGGSTGGDIFQVAASGGSVRNLTPGMATSASNITWPHSSSALRLETRAGPSGRS